MSMTLRHGLLLVSSLLLLSVGVMRAQDTLGLPAALVSYPDLLVFNAKIVSMDDPSTTNSSPGRIFEAMTIRGDRIQFLGSNAELLRYAGPQTRKVDLKGRTVVPGMINTHIHLHNGYLSTWARKNPKVLQGLHRGFSVTGNTFDELTQGIEAVIRENVGQLRPGEWLTIDLPGTGQAGVGIGTLYMNQKKITRERLDRLAPEVPIYVSTEAAFLLNTAGRDAFMRLYDVAPTDENERRTIIGKPSISASLAMQKYFRTHVPLAADIIEDGLKHFAATGYTGYSSHVDSRPIHDAFMLLAREGRMPVRFGFNHRLCQVMAVDIGDCFSHLSDMARMGDDYYWNVGVTLGAVDIDAPGICSTMEAPREIKAIEQCRLAPGTPYHSGVTTAIRTRLRYNVNHVMGDKSLDYLMDIMEEAMKEDPSLTYDYFRSLRVSADHCGFYPRQAQFPRMAKLGMIFSCAPKEIEAMSPFLKIYGEAYANRIEPIKSMLGEGIMVGLEGPGDGTEEENEAPFVGHIRYMTRKTYAGKLIAPEEAVDRVTLMKMSTIFPAYYLLKEKLLGSLEPGKLADFVVFNKDYFTIPEAEIPTVIPLMTVVGGEIANLREELAKELGVPAVGPQIKFKYQLEPPRLAEFDITKMRPESD